MEWSVIQETPTRTFGLLDFCHVLYSVGESDGLDDVTPPVPARHGPDVFGRHTEHDGENKTHHVSAGRKVDQVSARNISQ